MIKIDARITAVVGFFLCLLNIEQSSAWSLFKKDLSETHSEIVEDYQSVIHLSVETLQPLMKGNIILFDVRERDEYAVSHLPGAIWVSPDIDEQDFIEAYGDKIKGTVVVFYCSVGRRSSELTDKTQTSLIQKGAINVFNLEKGIFEWHNKRMPLVNSLGATDYIHPYNKSWGELINQSDLIRYNP